MPKPSLERLFLFVFGRRGGYQVYIIYGRCSAVKERECYLEKHFCFNLLQSKVQKICSIIASSAFKSCQKWIWRCYWNSSDLRIIYKHSVFHLNFGLGRKTSISCFLITILTWIKLCPMCLTDIDGVQTKKYIQIVLVFFPLPHCTNL